MSRSHSEREKPGTGGMKHRTGFTFDFKVFPNQFIWLLRVILKVQGFVNLSSVEPLGRVGKLHRSPCPKCPKIVFKKNAKEQ